MSGLLTTKFYRPSSPAKCVQRPHLIERLNEGIDYGRQVTLISAPAGFGKTTCASEWLDTLELPVAWLSLDSSDDDPIRFFTYFIAALQIVDENVGLDIEGVFRSGQLPDADALNANLINGILKGHLDQDKFLLVLDDFHVIHDQYILNVLEKLLTNIPRQLHLVLLTREDPPLPLARMRANNRITELRVSDLRFNNDEIDKFLKGTMGLNISRSDVVSLEERTEGWIAGLQLAGLSMRDRANTSSFVTSLSGSNRFILSYLTEEVLDRLPQETRQFLLHTSILDKLTGDLCDAVTQRRDGGVMLERLLTANLFLIPLDDTQKWYRYHHLFADSLRDRQKTLSNEDAKEMHRRAAKWYEKSGMINEAIQHFLAAKDFAMTTTMLEDHAMELISQGYAKTVENWLDIIPPEWSSKQLKSDMAFAWMYLLRGTYPLAMPYIERVRAAFNDDQKEVEVNASLKAEWLSLQSNILNAQGKTADSLSLSEQALEIAPEDNSFALCSAYVSIGSANMVIGNYDRSMEAYRLAIKYSRSASSIVSEMLSISRLALMAIQRGRLRYAYETAIEGIERAERLRVLPPITAAVYGSCGQVCYHWGDLAQAEKYICRSMELSTLSGHNAALAFNKVTLSRLYQVEGSIEKATSEIREAANLFQLGAPAWILPELVSQQIRIYLEQNRLDEAELVLKQHGFRFEGELSYPDLPLGSNMNHLSGLLYNSALRVLLYKAKSNEPLVLKIDLNNGLKLANQLVSAALSDQFAVIALETLLMRAKLHDILGDREAFLADIAGAIELAKHEGFVSMFIEEGLTIKEALSSLLDNNILGLSQSEHAKKVLNAFSRYAPKDQVVDAHKEHDTQAGVDIQNNAKPANNIDNDRINIDKRSDDPVTKSEQTILVEPLTDRELDVLRLMSEGLKYGEIADELFISLNTVRSHVKSAYSKLNVNNRTKAIETAHRLRLF
jgi:LuxR family maltose regulon positive regulatory protein